ncbi:MAG TPA: DUF2505 family protein [bacterium]|nr:DUF2505 family protein [bacterium]HPI76122.1 DUF2505 family protein [bacterium]HPN96024.1 DUF2505 family protein [bacterium]
MKSYKTSIDINAAAEDVLGLVTTAEWAEKEARADGALAARARIEKKDDGFVTLVVEREDPSRGPKGVKDVKTREKSVLTSTWDIKNMNSKWNVRTIGKEKLVKVCGTSRIEPRGDKCRYYDQGEVSIGIPIIGDIVAKAVVSDIEKAFPGKKGLMESSLKR